MAKQKLQITIPDKAVELLSELCEKKGYSKSVIIAMAIERMANAEKGESNEGK